MLVKSLNLYAFIGKLLGKDEKAASLIRLFESHKSNLEQKLSTIPESSRKSAYIVLQNSRNNPYKTQKIAQSLDLAGIMNTAANAQKFDEWGTAELSKEEREKEEQNAKEKALKEREDKLLFKERLSDVKDELLNRKLPISFAKYFVNEDNEQSLKEISEFEQLYRAEIQNEVNSKIKGVTLKTGDSTTNAGKSMAEQRNAQKQITNNPWA